MENKKKLKGIVLAGGSGSRLWPITLSTSKQLLPIYDKPMIYYPLSVLMLAGIKEISIITNKEYINHFKNLLGYGEEFGINLSFTIQEKPNGLAEAFILEQEFIGDDNVALILGDNIFHGRDFSKLLDEAANIDRGATIFGCYVNDPERYGVVDFKNNMQVSSIEEKPKNPTSNYAVTGLYFYDNSCVEKSLSLKPSKRGELEITDLNNLYLKEDNLRVKLLSRGFTWLDTGTHDSLLEASQFIKIIQEKQGLVICSPHEIAFRNHWINSTELSRVINKFNNNAYGLNLSKLLDGKNEN